MRTLSIDKITVHIGTGESGERLTIAEKLLRAIVKQKPVRAMSKKTIPAFSIKKNEPIGCKVTLRGNKAKDFLTTALKIIENKLPVSQFDTNGNFSFGIEEHTDFPGMKYDPTIGIYGMDVNVALKRAGYRISKRKIEVNKVPRIHKLTKEDAISFVKEKYGAEVV
ncbi:MAG: 50S ribosomal protein L5 [Euryarchaeota archaeon]|nr:50S ribosomal protein L5 [Euryarchaeota archaeon]MBU4222903.1 50S ribosomal protein L5 [Euryarchaeota archaeon]MBU4339462.1 50S ribosomal protein L5 [Euryarchaeota archaeon]MBU4454505.1 50S ribosomal protein L5 [Euryarchaeota archaeon]MCG2736563.1 50S ribosomal protein L5 [Candidatus Methanoperedenaceae archaeon]